MGCLRDTSIETSFDQPPTDPPAPSDASPQISSHSHPIQSPPLLHHGAVGRRPLRGGTVVADSVGTSVAVVGSLKGHSPPVGREYHHYSMPGQYGTSAEMRSGGGDGYIAAAFGVEWMWKG